MAKRIMKSYEMIPDRFKEKYFAFYQELYNPEKSVLDIKIKELISIAASLTAGCQGCLKGHIIKAVKHGATREEVGEAIAIAVGINAAAIVDQTDLANWDEDLVEKLWGNKDGKAGAQVSLSGEAAEEITP
ncbi:MAG: carboxymuconolactone decarboxylase family protein [bacterium]